MQRQVNWLVTLRVCLVVICSILKKEFERLLALSLDSTVQSRAQPIGGVLLTYVGEELKFDLVNRESNFVDKICQDFDAAGLAAQRSVL